jgi:hypothetical protein
LVRKKAVEEPEMPRPPMQMSSAVEACMEGSRSRSVGELRREGGGCGGSGKSTALHEKGIFPLDLRSMDFGLIGKEEGDEGTDQRARATKQRRSRGAGDGAAAEQRRGRRSGNEQSTETIGGRTLFFR